MSIISTYTNSFPMVLRGMANSTLTSPVSSFVETEGFEVCVCDGCDFVETAFTSNGGSYWQQDKKSFIRSKIFTTDTIVFSLLKEGVVVATINNSTFGAYYDFGSTSLINPLYKGFVIDWTLVQQTFGYGQYVFRTTHTSLGTDYIIDSHPFNVVEYNVYRADGTVRIESYQSGSIESGFDYTGIGWYQSLRIDGKLGNKTPNLIIDNYQDTKRNVKQIQSKIENTYDLNTQLLPDYIFDVLNEDTILANDIYITDYNLLNQKRYLRKNVYVSDIKDVVNQIDSKRANFVYEFKDKKDNILKRNVNGDFAIMPTQQSSTTIVEVKTLQLIFNFDIGESESNVITIDANSAGSFTSTTNDGSSGTITFDKNGGGYGAYPSSLAVSDTIQVKRTITTGEGQVILLGTYV